MGEDIAVKILKKNGLRILERNWHMGNLEIDIIAENRKEIAFVEVNTYIHLWRKACRGICRRTQTTSNYCRSQRVYPL